MRSEQEHCKSNAKNTRFEMNIWTNDKWFRP